MENTVFGALFNSFCSQNGSTIPKWHQLRSGTLWQGFPRHMRCRNYPNTPQNGLKKHLGPPAVQGHFLLDILHSYWTHFGRYTQPKTIPNEVHNPKGIGRLMFLPHPSLVSKSPNFLVLVLILFWLSFWLLPDFVLSLPLTLSMLVTFCAFATVCAHAPPPPPPRWS